MPSSIARIFGGQEITDERLKELAGYIKPMWGDVLILPSEDPDRIKVGGKELIVPEAARSAHPTEGLVISCGPDVDMVPSLDDDGEPQKDGDQVLTEPVFIPGDRVVFSKYTGMKVTFGDNLSFLLVPQHDIRGIMDPECPVLGKEKKLDFVPR